MINSRPAHPVCRVPVQTVTVHMPFPGHQYSHHPYITHFAGAFHAIWSCGRVNEDDLGQQIWCAHSQDGEHWSTPAPLLVPEAVGVPEGVLTSAGFYAHDGVLRAYYGYYEYDLAACIDGRRPQWDSDHFSNDMGYIESADGVHWSAPVSMGLALVPNLPPRPTRSGRLILCGNVLLPYSDDPTGTSFTPAGLAGALVPGQPALDDSEAFHKVAARCGWERLVCEADFLQTDDGVLHALLRTDSDTLWSAESRDDGASWSAPVPTEYTSESSKFVLGRLPDGRYYRIGNPTFGAKRSSLHITLSADGENFDTPCILLDEVIPRQYEGLHKGGCYGYPYAIQKDGRIWVIYSINKERVDVLHFDIKVLPQP